MGKETAMELKNLKVFLQIAESGSFSKAADQLGYTQSTISFHIKQLEEELGCSLFDRIGRRILITEQGEKLIEHARRVNDCMEDLQESFHNVDTIKGKVRMFSSDSICEKMMMLNYQNFYREYPEIELEFQTGSTLDLLKVLDRNEADIIFTLDTHIYQAEYIIKKESVVPLHFVANSAHPLAHKKGLLLQDLLDYPFLLTEKGMSYRKILDAHLAESNFQIRPVLETGRTDVIANCLVKDQGNAIGFLPDFVIEADVNAGSLVKLDVSDFQPSIWKQLIVHRDKWISRSLQAFIDFVVSHEFLW